MEKPIDEFLKEARRKNGYRNLCKECNKITCKKNYHKNREKRLQKQREYAINNPEKMRTKWRATQRKFRKNNREKIRIYQNETTRKYQTTFCDSYIKRIIRCRYKIQSKDIDQRTIDITRINMLSKLWITKRKEEHLKLLINYTDCYVSELAKTGFKL